MAKVALDRASLAATLIGVVASVADVEWRLVGTAASAIRGVDLPVADVDVLFRERAGVDASFARLSPRADEAARPEWLADAQQYFARLVIDGVSVELSTVEFATALDTFECFGLGPWIHYDDVDWRDVRVPAVASELRLVTEVNRGRVEHVTRLVEHLRRVGCDTALLERALVNAEVPEFARAQILEALSD
jgi:hypothetical protein